MCAFPLSEVVIPLLWRVPGGSLQVELIAPYLCFQNIYFSKRCMVIFQICLFLDPSFWAPKIDYLTKTQFENIKQALLYFIYLCKLEVFNRYMLPVHMKSPLFGMCFMFIKPILVDTYHVLVCTHSTWWKYSFELLPTLPQRIEVCIFPPNYCLCFGPLSHGLSLWPEDTVKLSGLCWNWLMTSTSLRQYVKQLQWQCFHE